MHRTVTLAAALLIVSPVVAAGELKTKVFIEDLDGDGTMEKIITRKFAAKDEGDYYCLEVLDDAGKPVWTGPKEASTENRLVFGSWDFGVSLPELLVDFDADGAYELIAPAPVSDVSPVHFRVLRWSNGEFRPARVGQLLEVPPGSGVFPWGKSENYQGCWISAFNGMAADGQIEVEITRFGGGGSAGTGTALVKPIKGGFKLQSWLKPLTDSEQGELQSVTPSPLKQAGASPPLARYMCQIGDEDLRNSKGERLAKVGDILAQDRANFHRYGIRHRRDIDEEDYFTTPERRESFYTLPIEGEDSLKDWILKGGAILEVTVYTDRIVLSQP